MKIYTISTEDKNREFIRERLDLDFPGYKIHEVIGVWKGIEEKAIDIVIVTNDRFAVEKLIERIKYHNDQEAVLLTVVDCEAVLI